MQGGTFQDVGRGRDELLHLQLHLSLHSLPVPKAQQARELKICPIQWIPVCRAFGLVDLRQRALLPEQSSVCGVVQWWALGQLAMDNAYPDHSRLLPADKVRHLHDSHNLLCTGDDQGDAACQKT